MRVEKKFMSRKPVIFYVTIGDMDVEALKAGGDLSITDPNVYPELGKVAVFKLRWG